MKGSCPNFIPPHAEAKTKGFHGEAADKIIEEAMKSDESAAPAAPAEPAAPEPSEPAELALCDEAKANDEKTEKSSEAEGAAERPKGEAEAGAALALPEKVISAERLGSKFAMLC